MTGPRNDPDSGFSKVASVVLPNMTSNADYLGR